MLEAKIVEHCAPALAGLKAANLFNYEFFSIENLRRELQTANQELNKKGVFIQILRINEPRALLYVYRKKMLAQDMKKPGVYELLKQYNYISSGVDCCIEHLKCRLLQCENFPHEIGLFLGYPLGDVEGFIKFKGKNCKCCGLWKVYCNECETMELFTKFKKCTDIYAEMFANGKSMGQLTIAA